MKAAEMAISNPLIDDYTLKGAKGLLVNITGGKDLKLFEVDEVVNKIRAEVDPEAEVIIGAITDAELDGKIRVSIVATALDGQHPEGKSVINMVHRIQNRNPGYSDFTNKGPAQSFNFSATESNEITNGANALKLENEIMTEIQSSISSSGSVNELNKEYNEQLLSAQQSDVANFVEDRDLPVNEKSFTEEVFENSILEEKSNGLENFGVENENTPDLFNHKK